STVFFSITCRIMYLFLLLCSSLPLITTILPYATLFRSDCQSNACQEIAYLGDHPDHSGDHSGHAGAEPVMLEEEGLAEQDEPDRDRKSTRLNSTRFDLVCRHLLEKKNIRTT